MNNIRLTMAQAVVRYMMAQEIVTKSGTHSVFAGVWGIFGHGNVAGLGEALYQVKEQLPTYRAHNEQAMAHASIAFAKTKNRQQMMACTTSTGPGSLNMVTAAAVAHVNRIPVLFLPGDTFASRMPDPVLQQVENFHDMTLTSNDCFRPVSRFFDRITRPEQLLTSLPQAMRVLLDPIECGPVTLSMPQDVQTMAFDYPSNFFQKKIHHLRRQVPDKRELRSAIDLIRQTKKTVVIAGGGLHYSSALESFEQFVSHHQLPVGETQAGKGALPWDHKQNMGSIGVTGATAANKLFSEADLVIAVGTRLSDFTTGSRTLIHPEAKILSINVNSFDAVKHASQVLLGDAKLTLDLLNKALEGWLADKTWSAKAETERVNWNKIVDHAMTDTGLDLPTDAQVIGAVNRAAGDNDMVLSAAGGLPGELQKLQRTRHPRGYHVEYGYSCMGYELAGGVGAKMATPDSDVFVMVGDGSYLMLNSEIATSVMLGQKIIAVVLDNRGFGCINRLQKAGGGAGFNNLFKDCLSVSEGAPKIDFAAHAKALGANAEKVNNIVTLEQALVRAKTSPISYVITLDTDPLATTKEGGHWWDVAIAEVSESEQVGAAREEYVKQKQKQLNNL